MTPEESTAIAALTERVEGLTRRLYGEGHDEGDIPAIRACVDAWCPRINRLELSVVALAVITGGGLGLLKWVV